MNTRCYRCGWSFSLSREAVEEAAVQSAGQKAHVVQCPRCRQAIRIPMDQVLRALPPGWTPPADAGEQSPAGEPPAAEAAAEPQPTPEPAEPTHRHSERRHRHAGKTNSGSSAAKPAAKKSTQPN